MQHMDSMLQGMPGTSAEQFGDHGVRGSGDRVAARSSGSSGPLVDQTAAAVTSSDHEDAPLLVVCQERLPEWCMAAHIVNESCHSIPLVPDPLTQHVLQARRHMQAAAQRNAAAALMPLQRVLMLEAAAAVAAAAASCAAAG